MDQIQKTALKETAKTIGTIFAGTFLLVTAIALLSVQVISYLILFGLLGAGTKMIYDIKLVQAKADAEAKMKVDQ